MADGHTETPAQGGEASGGAEGVWVAYYGDRSAVVVFAEEIDALRHAVEHSMSVRFVHYGDRDWL